jgi:hypothetical protein
MCNCIKESKNKIQEKYPEATNISFSNLELFSQRLYSEVEISVPNKKKPIKLNIIHSHCPICGQKYDGDVLD